MFDLERAINERHSTRMFLPKPVPRALTEQEGREVAARTRCTTPRGSAVGKREGETTLNFVPRRRQWLDQCKHYRVAVFSRDCHELLNGRTSERARAMDTLDRCLEQHLVG